MLGNQLSPVKSSGEQMTVGMTHTVLGEGSDTSGCSCWWGRHKSGGMTLFGHVVPLGHEPLLHEGFGVGHWGGESIRMPVSVILRGKGVSHVGMGGFSLIKEVFPCLVMEVKFSQGIRAGIIK